MTREEFQALLDQHDWHYAMSDDSQVYYKGQKAESALEEIANTDLELLAMYKTARIERGLE